MIITHSTRTLRLGAYSGMQSGENPGARQFQGAIDGDRNVLERNLLGLRSPKELKECKIEFLSPIKELCRQNFGMDFIRLLEPISFAAPKNWMFWRSPEHRHAFPRPDCGDLFRPGLCQPDSTRPRFTVPIMTCFFRRPLADARPLFDRKMKGFHSTSGADYSHPRPAERERWHGVTVLEQDVAVKEALKGHFSVVRVKPGTDRNSRQPDSAAGLPADSDLLKHWVTLDIEEAEKQDAQLKTKMTGLLEQAYAVCQRSAFLAKTGLHPRGNFGVSGAHLQRTIRRQSQVAIDRKQRRERMKATLPECRKIRRYLRTCAVWLKQPPLNWKKLTSLQLSGYEGIGESDYLFLIHRPAFSHSFCPSAA